MERETKVLIWGKRVTVKIECWLLNVTEDSISPSIETHSTFHPYSFIYFNILCVKYQLASVKCHLRARKCLEADKTVNIGKQISHILLSY